MRKKRGKDLAFSRFSRIFAPSFPCWGACFEILFTYIIVIQIERHIEALLLENDCVIVPGMGGFMAHHIDATYSEEEQMFLPPQRTIGFNPQLTMNDSLLVQSFIEVYDISYPDALDRIESEVRELRQRLETEGEYEMHNLGTLSFGEEGQLLFRPCEAGILTPSLYGLDTFEMPVLEESGQTAASGKGDNAKGTRKVKDEKAKPQQDGLIRHDSLVIPLSWVRGTVATVAAAIAFFFIVTPVANSYKEAGQGVVEHSAFFPFEMKNAPVENVITEQQVQMEATEETPSEEAVEVEMPAPTKNFTLVLASYVTQKGADGLNKRLAKKGFNEGGVYTSNHVTRVIYGSFATQEEAYAALKELRQQSSDFAEAWVFEKK
jgi:hypothetical protein